MSRVLVVESSPQRFEHWTNPDYGVGAQLEALGQDGSQVVVERIDSRADLLEVASEVKRSEHLPARALVFGDTYGTDLTNNPINAFWLSEKIEPPADYDEERDPIWVWRGDERRPLSPYGRLIGSRLVQRALPDVRFYPSDGEYENWDEKYRDIFHWAYAGMGYDELRTTYGGFLARVNKSLAITGRDFMSIVDTVGDRPYDRSEVVEGADIDLIFTAGIQPHVEVNPRARHDFHAVRHIAVVASLLKGDYPGASQEFDDINFILPRQEADAA